VSESLPASGLRRVPFLYLTMVMAGMGASLAFAIVPLVGREMRLHELVISLPWFGIEWQPRELLINALSAMTALISAMTARIWGRASDRIGRRRVIVIGLVGYSAGLFLFNLAAELGRMAILSGFGLYLGLVLSRVVYASIMSAVGPATAAYMADITTPAERAGGVGRLNSANQIGVMLGPALIFFAFISMLAPIYLLATLMALMAFLTWRLLPEGTPRLTHTQPSVRLGFFDVRYRRFMLAGMTIYAMIGLAQPTLAFYFQDKLHLDSATTAQRYSLAMMISSGAMVITQLGLVQRLRWTPLQLLKLGLPVTVAGYALMALATDIEHLWLAMACFGAGMGITVPAFNAGASLSVGPHEQGALAGLLGSAASLGYLFGPLLGGYLYGLAPALPFWAAALALLPLTVFIWLQRQ
jgi:MFS transporter, DHA1 family, multidrug resistance protein